MEPESKSDHNTCALCSLNMTNYGVGKCNHVVCGKCAIRMRVICHSKECPVCRQHLERIFVTHAPVSFDHLDQTKLILNSEFDMLFETQALEQYFEDLMVCKCKVCKYVCSSMSALNRHYNNKHQLMFCDLCMSNLKHFPVEFPVYNGSELVAHREWTPTAPGRGHPLCKFCERRYFDADEWYRHLRRDHFMCHICEREAADTTSKRTVFGDYEHLLDHCRTAHFVCEEGDCARQTFTNVFGSETELKAHRLQTHPLSKAAAKETRRLDVEIRFTGDSFSGDARGRGRGVPRPGGSEGAGRNDSGARAHRKNQVQESGLDLDMRNLPGMQQALEISQTVDAQLAARANGEVPYMERPSDFPTLGGHVPDFRRPNAHPKASEETREEEMDLWSGPKPAAPEAKRKEGSGPAPGGHSAAFYAQKQSGRSGFSADDFPALSGDTKGSKGDCGGGGVWNRSPASAKSATSARPRGAPVPAGAFGRGRGHSAAGEDDFPSLGGIGGGGGTSLPWKPTAPAARPQAPSAKPPPKFSGDDFPSLGGSGGIGGGGKSLPWQSSAKKPEPKGPKKTPPKKKSTPAPKIVPSSLNTPRVRNDDDDTVRWTPSFAEEKTGLRLSAQAAYESATPQGVGSKMQLIRAADPPPASGVRDGGYRLETEDFPSIGRTAPTRPQQPQWGISNSRDFYLEVPEEPEEMETPKAPLPVAPDMESAADFPSLGAGMPATGRTAPESRRGRKKKGRSQPSQRETDAQPPPPTAEPFSMGDLAADLLSSVYMSVPDMDARNNALLASLPELLGSRFERFANCSMRYRNRELSARAYLSEIVQFVSEEEIDSFMPEMLVLLPDVGLQRALLAVLKPALRSHIRECAACGQVVTLGDLQAHLAAH